jgi:hypothetical protein
VKEQNLDFFFFLASFKMTNIVQLPPEVLVGITDLIIALNIARLWLCGSRSLNWKLGKAGGVQTFNFVADSHFPSIVWPRMMAEFDRLRSLRIEVPIKTNLRQNEGIFPLLEPDIATLPRKLKILYLRFEHHLEFLVATLKTDPKVFQHLEDLTLSESPQIDRLPQPLELPSLTSLNIIPTINLLKLSEIPPTLTFLRANCKHLECDISYFPSRLTSLQLDLSNMPYELLQSLPESLQELSLLGEGCRSSNHLYDWSSIPRGLSSLTVAMSTLNVESILALPPSLKKLRVAGWKNNSSEVTVQFLQALPSGMIEISGIFSPLITDEIASLLPRNSKLHIYEKVLWSAIPLLPLGTRRLHLPDVQVPNFVTKLPAIESINVPSLTLEIASLLPITLTSLTIDKKTVKKEDGEIFKLLPRSITFIISMRDALFEDSSVWKDLPPRLKTMDVIPIAYGAGDGKHFVHCPVESSSWLPRSLVNMTIGDLDIIDAEWFSFLPPKLERLRVATRTLPDQSLEALQRSDHRSLRTLDIRILDAQSARLLASFVRNIPKFVTNFCISTGSDARNETDVTNDDLKSLPRGLISLELPLSPKINSECAPYLPKFLKTFTYGYYGLDGFFKDKPSKKN